MVDIETATVRVPTDMPLIPNMTALAKAFESVAAVYVDFVT